MYIRVKACNVL